MVMSIDELEAQVTREFCAYSSPWKHTEFSLKLFASLAEKSPGKNVFVSPIGVTAAPLVLYNAAGQASQDAVSTGSVHR